MSETVDWMTQQSHPAQSVPDFPLGLVG